MLEKIARFSYRRRWSMLLIWIVALIGFIAIQTTAGGSYSTDFSLPGAESQKAFDLLDKRFPNVAGDTADIVFKADQGVTDPAVETAMKGLFAEIMKVDRVVAIDSPYSERARGQISRDGAIAFATVHFRVIEDEAVPPFDARVLADAHGSAELRMINGAGHELLHDPRAVAVLLGWLDRQRSQATLA